MKDDEWTAWGAQISVQLNIFQVPAEGPEEVRLRIMFDNTHVGDVGVTDHEWVWVVTHHLFSSSLVRKFGEEITKCVKANDE